MALPQQVSPTAVASAVVVTRVAPASVMVVVRGCRLLLSDKHCVPLIQSFILLMADNVSGVSYKVQDKDALLLNFQQGFSSAIHLLSKKFRAAELISPVQELSQRTHWSLRDSEGPSQVLVPEQAGLPTRHQSSEGLETCEYADGAVVMGLS